MDVMGVTVETVKWDEGSVGEGAGREGRVMDGQCCAPVRIRSIELIRDDSSKDCWLFQEKVTRFYELMD